MDRVISSWSDGLTLFDNLRVHIACLRPGNRQLGIRLAGTSIYTKSNSLAQPTVPSRQNGKQNKSPVKPRKPQEGNATCP